MKSPEQNFVDAWKVAGPTLERMRRQKLVDSDEDSGLKSLGAFHGQPVQLHGMAIMQAWFMRLRLKELTDKLSSKGPTKSSRPHNA